MVKSGEKATQPGTLIKKLITKRQNLGGARVESRNKNHKPDTKSENRIPVPTSVRERPAAWSESC
jgi:hypothetical protein